MAKPQAPRPAPRPQPKVQQGGGVHGGKPMTPHARPKAPAIPMPCDANASTSGVCGPVPKKPVDRTIRPKRVPWINPYSPQEKQG